MRFLPLFMENNKVSVIESHEVGGKWRGKVPHNRVVELIDRTDSTESIDIPASSGVRIFPEFVAILVL